MKETPMDGCYAGMKFSDVDSVFSQADEVAAYDRMYKKFRDYAKSAEEVIRHLDLGHDSTVIYLGSGMGALALHVAKTYRAIQAANACEPTLLLTHQDLLSGLLINIDGIPVQGKRLINRIYPRRGKYVMMSLQDRLAEAYSRVERERDQPSQLLPRARAEGHCIYL